MRNLKYKRTKVITLGEVRLGGQKKTGKYNLGPSFAVKHWKC